MQAPLVLLVDKVVGVVMQVPLHLLAPTLRMQPFLRLTICHLSSSQAATPHTHLLPGPTWQVTSLSPSCALNSFPGVRCSASAHHHPNHTTLELNCRVSLNADFTTRNLVPKAIRHACLRGASGFSTGGSPSTTSYSSFPGPTAHCGAASTDSSFCQAHGAAGSGALPKPSPRALILPEPHPSRLQIGRSPVSSAGAGGPSRRLHARQLSASSRTGPVSTRSCPGPVSACLCTRPVSTRSLTDPGSARCRTLPSFGSRNPLPQGSGAGPGSGGAAGAAASSGAVELRRLRRFWRRAAAERGHQRAGQPGARAPQHPRGRSLQRALLCCGHGLLSCCCQLWSTAAFSREW